MIAWVARQSWAGLTFSKCDVLKINPKRSRVRHLEGGFAKIGSVGLVPNEAIRLHAKAGSPSAIPIMRELLAAARLSDKRTGGDE